LNYWGSSPGRSKRFVSSSQHRPTTSSYPVGFLSPSSGVKRSGRESDQSHPSGHEVNNDGTTSLHFPIRLRGTVHDCEEGATQPLAP
jgi:hypothetical protein